MPLTGIDPTSRRLNDPLLERRMAGRNTPKPDRAEVSAVDWIAQSIVDRRQSPHDSLLSVPGILEILKSCQNRLFVCPSFSGSRPGSPKLTLITVPWFRRPPGITIRQQILVRRQQTRAIAFWLKDFELQAANSDAYGSPRTDLRHLRFHYVRSTRCRSRPVLASPILKGWPLPTS